MSLCMCSPAAKSRSAHHLAASGVTPLNAMIAKMQNSDAVQLQPRGLLSVVVGQRSGSFTSLSPTSFFSLSSEACKWALTYFVTASDFFPATSVESPFAIPAWYTAASMGDKLSFSASAKGLVEARQA